MNCYKFLTEIAEKSSGDKSSFNFFKKVLVPLSLTI